MKVCDNCLASKSVRQVPIGHPPDRHALERRLDLCEACLNALHVKSLDVFCKRYEERAWKD